MNTYALHLKNNILAETGLDAITGDLKSFPQEPTFMMYILDNNIPLIIDGEYYYPLCREFPASPGIDIIYFGEKGNLLLAEFKNRKYQTDICIYEALSRFELYKTKTIADLVEYVKTRLNDISNMNSRFIDWLDLHKYEGSDTFHDLMKRGRLLAGVCANCRPDTKLYEQEINSVIITGINIYESTAEECSYIEIFTDSSMWLKMSLNELAENAKISYEKYEVIKSKNRKPRFNDKHQIQNYYDNELDPDSVIFYIYNKIDRDSYWITPGTGRQKNMLIQTKDLSGKRRTILEIQENGLLMIPSNLYEHTRYYNKTIQEIDGLFNDLLNIFSSDECFIKDYNLKLDCNRLNMKEYADSIDIFLKRIHEFFSCA